jgi:hypothetical protein
MFYCLMGCTIEVESLPMQSGAWNEKRELPLQ